MAGKCQENRPNVKKIAHPNFRKNIFTQTCLLLFAHTCSEQSLRILMWNASNVQKPLQLNGCGMFWGFFFLVLFFFFWSWARFPHFFLVFHDFSLVFHWFSFIFPHFFLVFQYFSFVFHNFPHFFIVFHYFSLVFHHFPHFFLVFHYFFLVVHWFSFTSLTFSSFSIIFSLVFHHFPHIFFPSSIRKQEGGMGERAEEEQ